MAVHTFIKEPRRAAPHDSIRAQFFMEQEIARAIELFHFQTGEDLERVSFTINAANHEGRVTVAVFAHVEDV